MKSEKVLGALPLKDKTACLGKTVVKIGVCPNHNTCRVVFDDGSMLWVQSVADDQLLLKHGLFAKTIPSGEEAEELGSSPHVEWSSISCTNVKGDSRRSDEETSLQNAADDDNAKTNFSAPKASSPPSCSPSWLNRLSWVAMLWIILAPLLNLESHGQIMDKLRFLWGAYPLTMAVHLAALAILSARLPRILRAVQT